MLRAIFFDSDGLLVDTERMFFDYDEAKPSPQAYLTALARIELSVHECLAVEDSPRGAVAARAAGLRCAVVPTPLTAIGLCPEGCEVLRDFSSLPELLTRMVPIATPPRR